MTTKKYYVPIRVVQQSWIIVEANDPDEVANIITAGEADMDIVDLVMQRTRHSDPEWEWDAESIVEARDEDEIDVDKAGLVE